MEALLFTLSSGILNIGDTVQHKESVPCISFREGIGAGVPIEVDSESMYIIKTTHRSFVWAYRDISAYDFVQ